MRRRARARTGHEHGSRASHQAMTDRDHYCVHELRTAELDAIKRRLQARLIKLPPGCPETVPVLAHICAIEAEQARRAESGMP